LVRRARNFARPAIFVGPQQADACQKVGVLLEGPGVAWQGAADIELGRGAGKPSPGAGADDIIISSRGVTCVSVAVVVMVVIVIALGIQQ
jgi:hypothetical protein